jgi:hypothetical protein
MTPASRLSLVDWSDPDLSVVAHVQRTMRQLLWLDHR